MHRKKEHNRQQTKAKHPKKHRHFAMSIHQKLCDWYLANKRDLPWRNTTNPYQIWLSEIILQQTRVQQGLPYYMDFITHFPKVEDLATAKEDEILRHWQGLGYYSRARNLHRTAKIITDEYKGIFPDTYEGLLSLKGIGPYTAAAIASFAFKRPCAVLDGNVYRVLARLYDIDLNIFDSSARKLFLELAESTMDKSQADVFNQAIMEFGALQCTAPSPRCEDCPLSEHCLSLAHKTVGMRPVRIKNQERRQRFLHYLCLCDGSHVWIKQRQQKDIWQGLWEFPLFEEDREFSWEELLAAHPEINRWMGDHAQISRPLNFRHQLTHQLLFARFFPVTHIGKNALIPNDYLKVAIEDLDNYAFSRLGLKYMEKMF